MNNITSDMFVSWFHISMETSFIKVGRPRWRHRWIWPTRAKEHSTFINRAMYQKSHDCNSMQLFSPKSQTSKKWRRSSRPDSLEPRNRHSIKVSFFTLINVQPTNYHLAFTALPCSIYHERMNLEVKYYWYEIIRKQKWKNWQLTTKANLLYKRNVKLNVSPI